MAQIVETTLNGLHFPFKQYVLVLPGWYPTWQDPYTGDFNQRHVLAAGLKMPQLVLYISKDQTGRLSSVEMRCYQVTENVVEVIAIYPSGGFKWWEPIRSNVLFSKLLKKYTKQIRAKFGLPALLHAYIVIRGGVAASWLAKKWGLAVLLTENWTIYYAEDPGYLLKRNFVFRVMVKKVFKRVSRFLPVTLDLERRVFELMKPVSSTVIPNTVDTSLFYAAKEMHEAPFTFIHVSTMTYQKNPYGLLRAFKKFSDSRGECRLILVGPYPAEVFEFATAQQFREGAVIFTGSVQYSEVALLLRRSNALVLFSRYENLPCVILEALCSGLPVISTRVGGIAEVISSENGILINNEDEASLVKALEQVYTNYHLFKNEKIAERALSLFSYKAVGQQINKVYAELLGPTS